MTTNRMTHFANLSNCVSEIVLTQAALEALADRLAHELPGESQILNVLARNLEIIAIPLERHTDALVRQEEVRTQAQNRRGGSLKPKLC
ncbi:hypothetical protein [Desulfoluna butyratoxydans]|uniref:Uncharacterized protein n=1 Tax=Desulfoluna butyratoxydans TaxID=231438 RepID=A0A4U8YUY1_9BACT|nr:hypothetical protein [Desulfoluna butyratoxydans]VFQ47229.1 hypothetical protein MSL71_49180 [Desulfoluna butyratoxydans]